MMPEALILVIGALLIVIYLIRKSALKTASESSLAKTRLEGLIKTLENELSQLQLKYQGLTDLEEEKRKVSDDINRLKQNRDQMVGELTKLTSDCNSQKTLLDNLSEETKKLEKSVADSSLLQRELRSSIESLNSELEHLNKDRDYVSELVKDKSSLAAEINNLKEERDQMVDELAKLTSDCNSQENLLGNLGGEIKRIEEGIAGSSILQGELRSTIENLNRELEHLNKERDYVSELVKDKSSLAAEIEKLKNDRDQMVSESDGKMASLNAEYIDAKKIYETLKEELQKLEESLEISSFGLYKPHYNYDTPESYKIELDKSVEEAKEVIKGNRAVICTTEWTVNDSVVQGRKLTRQYSKVMLRAFNGECDAAVLKVRWNNISNMEERILRAYAAINKLGETHKSYITDEYLQLKLKELRLTYEYQEKLHEEKEEQRRIREQLREEEKSIREIEKARAEAEKEEVRYAKALRRAREELLGAKEDEIAGLKNKISDLELNLKNAQELKERAISMAQITKAGHVYVISNIGSFGENVYKIGMTRRMEPADRVRELSGASVPFGFDIHALIYSENAPELESKFHKKFTFNRLNLINNRKEFFNVTLTELEQFAQENGYTIEFTKIAEARDYRQTCSIRNIKSKEEIEAEMGKVFPDSLLDLEDDEQLVA